MLKYIVTSQDTIVLYLDGKMHIVDPSHSNHAKVFAEIRAKTPSLENLRQLVDVGQFLSEVTDGLVTVKNGNVFYDGEQLSSELVTRITEMLSEGQSPLPFIKFLNNLMNNPSKHSVDQLFDFLKHAGLPITENGHVIGYKKVKEDYTDWYSGKFKNTPGSVHKMKRNSVDDDPNQTCSYGFHVGTLKYARDTFNPGHGLIVLVSFDPADVVSVPVDYNGQKLRTCQYKVLSDYDGVSELEGTLYTTEGTRITPNGFQAIQKDMADQWIDREAEQEDEYDGEFDDDDDDDDWNYEDEYEYDYDDEEDEDDF